VIAVIHKSDPAGDVSSYRPTSLTSVFRKSMERVIVKDLSCYLLAYKLINKRQHGFLRSWSTVTSLTETVGDWLLAVGCKHTVAAAYIDYSIAFDDSVAAN
jgi:hypothetical protein